MITEICCVVIFVAVLTKSLEFQWIMWTWAVRASMDNCDAQDRCTLELNRTGTVCKTGYNSTKNETSGNCCK